ncbi:hypothetical protein SB773_31585, partial [Bacillus sp. SIMBA_074]
SRRRSGGTGRPDAPAGRRPAHNRPVSRTTYTRYVALGDSLTEGLCDSAPGQPDAFLGWADRLAGILDGDARLAGESVEFANLAVRGRRIA